MNGPGGFGPAFILTPPLARAPFSRILSAFRSTSNSLPYGRSHQSMVPLGMRIRRIIQFAGKRSGNKLGKRVWQVLTIHESTGLERYSKVLPFFAIFKNCCKSSFESMSSVTSGARYFAIEIFSLLASSRWFL